VGYSVTYVFGVVGMLIAAAWALRGKTEPKVSAVPEPEPELTMRSVRVESTGLPTLRELITEFDDRIRFSRVRHDRRVSYRDRRVPSDARGCGVRHRPG
jgi:putative transport protein